VTDCLATPDGLALITAFWRIKDSDMRRSIVGLVERIAPPAEQQQPGKHEVIEFPEPKRKAAAK